MMKRIARRTVSFAFALLMLLQSGAFTSAARASDEDGTITLWTFEEFSQAVYKMIQKVTAVQTEDVLNTDYFLLLPWNDNGLYFFNTEHSTRIDSEWNSALFQMDESGLVKKHPVMYKAIIDKEDRFYHAGDLGLMQVFPTGALARLYVYYDKTKMSNGPTKGEGGYLYANTSVHLNSQWVPYSTDLNWSGLALNQLGYSDTWNIQMANSSTLNGCGYTHDYVITTNNGISGLAHDKNVFMGQLAAFSGGMVNMMPQRFRFSALFLGQR